MVDRPLIRARLVAQGLVARPWSEPADVAAAFLASQGQDLPGVVSSLALRQRPSDRPGPDDRAQRVIDAFARGEIVRGYPMRGTVFAMVPADARWLTELCAVPQRRASLRRLEELLGPQAPARLDRAAAAAREAADAPAGVARADLMDRWEQEGLPVRGGAGYHLLTQLIMRGDLIHGGWDAGENRVLRADRALPADGGIAGRFDGDEDAAVAELLLRVLLSRGPATIRDVGWFSKLPLGRLRAALPRIRDRLAEAGPDARGEMRYCRPSLAAEVEQAGPAADGTFLLPGFDELVLGYPDRLDLVEAADHPAMVPGNNGIFQRTAVRRGTVIGIWRRSGRPGARDLAAEPFSSWPAIAHRQVRAAYSAFPFPGP